MSYQDPRSTKHREQRLLEYISRREGQSIPHWTLTDIYEPRGVDPTTISKVIKRLVSRGQLMITTPSSGSTGNAYKVLRKEPMKLRELAHGFDQAGVPSSYRATPQTFSDFRRNDTDRRIVSYIKAHKGTKMNRRELGAVMGFASSGAISIKLRELRGAGLIDWKKAKGAGMYQFWAPESKLPKGDSRNGEVKIVRPAQVEALTAPEISQAAKVLEREWLTNSPAELPTKSQEEVFVEMLDGFIWEFLKTYTVEGEQYKTTKLGEALTTLREFSKFMKASANERK